MVELLYKDEVYAIIGAAMEVYNHPGPGFLESVYQEALEIELYDRAVPYCSQAELPISYKGRQLKKYFIADFVVFEKVVVEIKALNCLTSDHESQLINQLKATGLQVGVLVNFGYPHKLEWKRMIWTPKKIMNTDKSGYIRQIRED
jgi:GxxExxY protein